MKIGAKKKLYFQKSHSFGLRKIISRKKHVFFQIKIVEDMKYFFQKKKKFRLNLTISKIRKIQNTLFVWPKKIISQKTVFFLLYCTNIT